MPPAGDPPDRDLNERLSALEAQLDRVRRDLNQIRFEAAERERGRPRVATAAPVEPPPRTRASPRARPELDLESAVGRYGTIVVATIAILLGVGAFLQWAIARGLLGPTIRVILGALAAAAVAGVALRLRRAGAERFANILFAISLAIVHVDAWAAGPLLGVVHPYVALAVAASASVALAVLAIRDGEEMLFVVGVGGALLAPFVTSDGPSQLGLLLVYGFGVLTSAIVAARESRWELSRFVIVGGTGVYLAAAAAAIGSTRRADWEHFPMTFALAVSVAAIVLAEPTGRRRLAGRLLALSAFTLLASTWSFDDANRSLVHGLMGLMAVHAMRLRSERVAGDRDNAMHAMLLPIAFYLATLPAYAGESLAVTLGVASPWVAASVFFGRQAPPRAHGWHLAVALLAATIALLTTDPLSDLARTIGAAGIAAATAIAAGWAPGPALLAPLGFSLLAATVAAAEMLEDRQRFAYTPFATLASLASLTVVGAWQAVAMRAGPILVSRLGPTIPDVRPSHGLIRSLGVIAALGWGQRELARAFSADIATFNLIAYYALAGVLLIHVGRSRGSSGMRASGLAVALVAAFKAVLQASSIDAIGLRVGSYLLVGVFLLAVGYWYRVREPSPSGTGDGLTG